MGLGSLLPLVLLGAIGASGTAFQSPGLPEPIATRQTLFAIPFRVDETADPMSAPAEIQLFVSNDQGRNWQLYARAAPTERRFLFRAGGEGEYWFQVRTVDRSGRLRAPTGNLPEMRVVVDTTPPQLKLEAFRGEAGQIIAQWEILDANPDPQSLVVQYRTAQTPNWQLVAVDWQSQQVSAGAVRGQVTWWPQVESGTVQVRAETRDRAGNPAISHAQVDLTPAPDRVAGLPAGGTSFSSTPGDEQTQWRPSSASGPDRWPSQPDRWPPQSALGEAGSAAPPGRYAGSGSADAAASNQQAGVPTGSPTASGSPSLGGRQPGAWDSSYAATPNYAAQSASPPPSSAVAPSLAGAAPQAGQSAQGFAAGRHSWPETPSGSAPASAPGAGSPAVSQGLPTYDTPPGAPASAQPNAAYNPPYASNLSGAPSAPTTGIQPGQSTPAGLGTGERLSAETSGGAAVRMVNSPAFELEYQTEPADPGAIRAVELWGTEDQGRTWRRFAVDSDAQSPLLVRVDREGLYGFRLVVWDNQGRSTPQPQPGDQPEIWVGVDLTPPKVQLTGVQLDQSASAKRVLITWTAEDWALAEDAVSLFVSLHPGGPWEPIVRDYQNTGRFLWTIDRPLPDRVFVRIEVRDQAGNVASDELVEPVVLQVREPQVSVRQVRPLDPAAGPAPKRYYIR